MRTVSLAVISVKTASYIICKNSITNDYVYVSRCVSPSIAFVLPCILYACMHCICESNSVELPIHLFIIIIIIIIISIA